MSTDLDTTADIISEWLDPDVDITVTGRAVIVAIDDTHTAHVTLDDNTATVQLRRGHGILGEQRVAFYDPAVSGYLAAAAVQSYRDMISAGVVS